MDQVPRLCAVPQLLRAACPAASTPSPSCNATTDCPAPAAMPIGIPLPPRRNPTFANTPLPDFPEMKRRPAAALSLPEMRRSRRRHPPSATTPIQDCFVPPHRWEFPATLRETLPRLPPAGPHVAARSPTGFVLAAASDLSAVNSATR